MFIDVPQIDCDMKAAKIINPEFIAKCPAGCQDVKYRVYGTDIYASFSSMCGAAIHRSEGFVFVYTTQNYCKGKVELIFRVLKLHKI